MNGAMDRGRQGFRALSLLAGVAAAFARRGVLVYASYKAKASLGLVSLLGSVLTFVFVGRVVSEAGPGFAARYGMTYGSFVIVGVLVHALASSGLHAFRGAVRREQLQGTLEAVLASRLPVPAVVALEGVGELVSAAGGATALALLAVAVSPVKLPFSPSLVAAVALYGATMCGIGLASAGIVLLTKEGEPVSWIFSVASGLVGGVYFPTDLLPAWVRCASVWLPTTHALCVARSVVASCVRPGGAASIGSASVGRSLLYLAASAVVSVSAGLVVLGWCSRRARRVGTLGEY